MNLKNKYNLHLKYKFVIKELSKLTNNLQAKYNNIPFKLDTNNNILHAHTIDAINKNPNVLIGINNLTTDIHKLTNEINNTNTTTNTPNAFSRVPDLNFLTLQWLKHVGFLYTFTSKYARKHIRLMNFYKTFTIKDTFVSISDSIRLVSKPFK